MSHRGRIIKESELATGQLHNGINNYKTSPKEKLKLIIINVHIVEDTELIEFETFILNSNKIIWISIKKSYLGTKLLRFLQSALLKNAKIGVLSFIECEIFESLNSNISYVDENLTTSLNLKLNFLSQRSKVGEVFRHSFLSKYLILSKNLKKVELIKCQIKNEKLNIFLSLISQLKSLKILTISEVDSKDKFNLPLFCSKSKLFETNLEEINFIKMKLTDESAYLLSLLSSYRPCLSTLCVAENNLNKSGFMHLLRRFNKKDFHLDVRRNSSSKECVQLYMTHKIFNFGIKFKF